MIRANDLRGRAVVELDAAEKLGEVADVLLDLDARRLGGLVVSLSTSFIANRHPFFLPCAAIHAIGPDAVTTRRYHATAEEASELASLPHLSQLLGRKIINHSGALLGTLADVLIVATDRHLAGFAFDPPNGAGSLGMLMRSGGVRYRDYVRADADIRFGHALLVVPDDAVVRQRDADRDEPRPVVGSAAVISRVVGSLPRRRAPVQAPGQPTRPAGQQRQSAARALRPRSCTPRDRWTHVS
jgi:sporulation protein YlmC with PRC-barrel domain